MASLTPEARLLLLCAQSRRADMESLRDLIESGLDWDRFWRLARWHGLLPLAAHHLHGIEVPTDIAERLRRQARAVAWKNTVLARELLQVVQRLREHGIRALPFKGPALAMLAYGDLTLRTCSDLDVLVPKPDVLRAKNLLLEAGYRTMYPLSEAQERLHLRTGYHYNLVKIEGALPLELHWQVSDPYFPFRVDTEALWSRKRDVQVEGEAIETLGLEDTLLVLCLHGAKHLWENLKLVADVAELLKRNPEVDWEQLLRLGKEARGLRATLLSLHLAHDLLQAPVPNEVLNRADPPLKQLAGDLADQLLARTEAPGGAEIYTGQLRLLDDWSSRARYCARVMAPNIEDWGQAPLPGYLLPFYALTRPVRLLRKYLGPKPVSGT